MTWNVINSIATLISTVAIVVTALYVRAELKALDKDRYLAVTNQLFSIWQTGEFMEAQLWLLYRLEETTWPEFVKAHRAQTGEAAFHRVGSFYDRVGTLVRLGLVNDKEILATIGAHAIAVWQKIQPLVREARQVEHSTLFADFERLLPSCYECYVPALGENARVRPFALSQPEEGIDRISQSALRRRLEKGDPLTLLDVRRSAQVADDPRTLPQAVVMPAEEVEKRVAELPTGREVVAYCA